MKIANFFGISYHFMPSVLANVNNTTTALTESLVKEGNKILFFDGAMPADDTLYAITTEVGLRAAYTPIMEIAGLQFTYTYTKSTKKKMIKKLPVDAIDTTFLGSGTIGWAAIILTGATGVSGDIILFTDSIGGWGDDDMPIIIDTKTGNIGDKNVFKDFSLILRDTSSNEVA